MQHRSLFVLLGVVLAFAINSARKSAKPHGNIPWWDLVLIAVVAVSCLNIFFRQEYYMLEYATVDAPFEYIAGAALVILVLEAGRRTIGWTFPLLCAAMLAYAFLGPLIPGQFGHLGTPWKMLLQILYQSGVGIWGLVTGIVAKTVSVFIIFGALLQFTGGGQTFIDLAQIVAGRFRGGPAMVATISSAMFGTMSGSVVANVATTGNFTIPLMKKLGYRSEFAGGVEAAASTVGQLMPPIMGSAAFIMAELLGVPYLTICIAAFVPAMLYFISIFSMVRLEAIKANLAPLPREQIPSIKQTFTWGRLAPLFLPIIVLIVTLFLGYTADRCAFYAIVTAVVIYMFTDFSPSGWLQRFKNIIVSLERGAITLVQLVPLIVCAQIVITLVSLTGLSPKFTAMILGFAGETLWIALFLTAVISLILGMGIPTTAAYVLVAGVVSSAVIKLGVPHLNAHLFIFYFAIISSITPPVCVAAFTAATIAQTNWWKVGWIAVRLALISYIMPFLFVYRPSFLLQGEPTEVLVGIVTAIIGIIFISSSFVGYLNTRLFIGTRFLFLPAGALFFVPGLLSDSIALALVAAGFVINYLAPKLWRRAHGIRLT